MGLLLSLVAAVWQSKANEQRVHSALRDRAVHIQEAVAERLSRYALGLSGLRSAMLTAGLERVDRSALRAYAGSRDLTGDYPGARGFGFVRRVPASDESAFVALARADGWPEFSIRQIAPHDGERFVVQYIEPVEANRESVGLDIASDAARREAALSAARSGSLAMTPPVTLVQASGQHMRGFLLMLPVYRPGLPLSTEQERWRACVGWTIAPLVIDDVLRALPVGLPNVRLLLEDLGATPAVRFFGASAPAASQPQRVELAHRSFGREWRMIVEAEPGFEASLQMLRPAQVFSAGALVSLLLAALAAAYRQSQLHAEAVRREERRLARMVEHTSDAIVVESLDGRITAWNRAAERLLGHVAGEAIGREAAALLSAEGQWALPANVRSRLERGDNIDSFDQVLRHKDGSPVEVSVSLAPVYGAAGELVGTGRTIRDMRTRAAAERERQRFTESLEQAVAERTRELDGAKRDLRAILDAVPSMIGYWDRGLRNRFANHACQTWFGLTAEELQGRTLPELLGPELFALDQPSIDAALAGKAQTFVRAIPRPDGQGERHSLAHYLPDVMDGQVLGFYMLVHDISEQEQQRRRLTEVLRENEALLGTLKSHSLYSVTDSRGTIIDVNEGFCRISGYSREELIGQNHRLINSGRHPAVFWQAMWGTVTQGRPWRGQVCNRAKDGSLYWVDSMIAPFVGSDGQVQKYVSIRHDITVTKRAEAAMQEAVKAAQAASDAKSQFLANMSHEIRTPLNAMIGLSHLLGHTQLDAEQRDLIGKVQLSSRSLLGVVNDVLDLAKIEAGQSQLERVPFVPADELRAVASLYADQARSKQIAFELQLAPDLPVQLLGDAGRLRQVISNLLGNAIKFTQQGSITLRAARVPPSEPGVTLRIEVEDTGIGIDAAAQDEVFKPFVQADVSTTRHYGGTGLGLSIVRQLVGLMGGEVDLRSQPGRGSTFGLTLRFDPAPDLASPAAGLTPPRLLCALADAGQRDALMARATALGWRTTGLPSGHSASDQVREATEGGDPFDVLIVDPSLSAAATLPLRVVLERDLGSDRMPAVVLAGTDADLLQRQQAEGLGDAVLTLPSADDTLRDALNQALAQRSAPQALPPTQAPWRSGSELGLPGVVVLVTDDSDINREVADRLLTREGATVLHAASGGEALDRLRDAETPIDIVLMDVQMPGMDGHEATRRLRTELGLHRLPVVALTAGALHSERQRAKDAGMDEFLTKPLEPDSLIACIRRLVQRARGEPLPTRARTMPSSAEAARSWPQIEGIDAHDAAQRLGNDSTLFLSLLSRLLDEFEDLRCGSVPAPADDDPDQARQLAARAHKLRGSAGVLGARAVSALATEVEDRLKGAAGVADGPDATGALPAIAGGATIEGLLADLATALQRLWEASQPALTAARAPSPLAPGEAPTAARLSELRDRLIGRELGAIDLCEELAPGLSALLGPARAQALQQAVESLDFDRALSLLEERAPA